MGRVSVVHGRGRTGTSGGSDKALAGSVYEGDSGVWPQTPVPPPSLSLLKHYLHPQDPPAGTWGILHQLADCWTALRPWEVDPGHRRPLLFWEVAAEQSDCLSHPRPSLYIIVTASQCPDASWRFSPSVALIAFKKTNHTVSSKVFFDVCSSPSPGAVRSDFGMKAQSLSDLSFFLPASLPPYVYTLPENLREPGRCPSGNTRLERSPGLESALAPGSCPGLDPGLSMVCGFWGSGESLPACPLAVTSCSGPHCSCV